MAEHYFFTDIDLMNSQSSLQCFGPLTPSGGMDRFRITSIHQASANPTAYAICDGTICAQADPNNSGLVHLILKPTGRPGFNIGAIAYYVYKGVLKSSIVDGNGDIVVNSNNELLTAIKDSQDAFNAAFDEANNNPSGTTTTVATGDALGLNLNSSVQGYSDSDPIDNLFYANTNSFQFPNVKPGWALGQFDAAAFGIEIIMDEIGYQPKLELSRRTENIIAVTSLTGSETQAQEFLHWHQKEEVLKFQDASAFFGSFYFASIRARTSTGGDDKKSGNQVFDDVLKGAQHTSGNTGSFFNRSTAYLDIRNDFNQSFDYYNNYGSNFSIAYDTGNSLTEDYYHSGWPIFRIENSFFSTGNTSDKNVVRVALPQDDNTNPLVLVSQGHRNLTISPFRRLNGKKRFIEPTYNSSELFGNELELLFANNSGVGTTTLISSIIKLRYYRRLNAEAPNTPLTHTLTSIKPRSFLDNLFTPFNMSIPFPATTGTRVRVFDDEAYSNKSEGRTNFVSYVGIAEDNSNIVLFAFEKEIRQRFTPKFNKPISIVSHSNPDVTDFMGWINQEIFQRSLSLGEFEISASSVQILTFNSENVLGQSVKSLLKRSGDEIVILMIDKTTFMNLQGLITSSGLDTTYKIFFGTKDLSRNLDDNFNEYSSYEIVLRGLKEVSGAMEVTEVPTSIIMYSYDNI